MRTSEIPTHSMIGSVIRNVYTFETHWIIGDGRRALEITPCKYDGNRQHVKIKGLGRLSVIQIVSTYQGSDGGPVEYWGTPRLWFSEAPRSGLAVETAVAMRDVLAFMIEAANAMAAANSLNLWPADGDPEEAADPPN